MTLGGDVDERLKSGATRSASGLVRTPWPTSRRTRSIPLGSSTYPRVVSFALWEAPGVVTSFDDFAVVGAAIKQGGGHLRVSDTSRFAMPLATIRRSMITRLILCRSGMGPCGERLDRSQS